MVIFGTSSAFYTYPDMTVDIGTIVMYFTYWTRTVALFTVAA